MHIQLGPDAPLLARAAVTSILVLHIGAGCVGLGAGAVALATRKGERAHRMAGNAFFGAMLTTLAIGAAAAPFIGQPVNTFGGLFGIYLVVSGWATVRRPEGPAGRYEIGAMVVPLAAVPLLLAFGWMGAHAPGGTIEGVPYLAAYIIAGVAACAAALDLSVILRRGVFGAQRVARHLWRMCLALFFASASLFIGQPQVFPAPLRGSLLPLALAFAPLALMIFWLLRVQFTSAFRPLPAPAE